MVAGAQTRPVNHWETVVYANDTWRYFPGNSDPGSSWKDVSFNDHSWQQGSGGIGFEDGDDNTVISWAPSLFMRITFHVIDLAKISSVLFHIDYDDGFIAYINGTEIARAGITGNPPVYNAYASNHEAEGTPTGYAVDNSVLVNGENILAIEVHNTSATSSDMSSIPYLSFGISDTTHSYRAVPSWFQEPSSFTGSNLPIFIIKTENQAPIVDEPKVNAHLKIVNHESGMNYISDTATDYDGVIGIELRGAYSQSLPQKPYGFETRDLAGQNNNVSLLGMPKENDWILLANYNEKTFARNPLSFYLFNKMGHYAPRSRLCEVMLNDSYDGIYLFTEKIKRDDNRVDIAKLDADDNAGDSLTGGYMFKIDYYSNTDSWLGSYSPVDYQGTEVHYVYYDPNPDELSLQQKNYIKTYINTFETVLYSNIFNDYNNGYRKYLDVPSFVDYFILGELSRNVDAYKKSRYFYKDNIKKGGMIHSGPVWDFDWAWLYLIDDCPHFDATDGSGWAYRIDECGPWPSPSGWEVRLMQDNRFVKQVYDRYFDLRNSILSNNFIHTYIDSIADLVSEAQVRHYQRWDILGIDVGAPEHPPIPATYTGEVQRLKEWIDKRLAWLDANMPGGNIILPTEDLSLTYENVVRIFPNPATNFFYIESEYLIQTVEIFNTSGISQKTVHFSTWTPHYMNSSDIGTGLYFVKITFEDGSISTKKLLIREN